MSLLSAPSTGGGAEQGQTELAKLEGNTEQVICMDKLYHQRT